MLSHNNSCSGVIPVQTEKIQANPFSKQNMVTGFGNKRMCFWFIIWSLVQSSYRKSIVNYFLNCAMHFKTDNRECWGQEFFYFTMKNGCPHNFNNSKVMIGFLIILLIALISCPVTNIPSNTSRTGLRLKGSKKL